MATIRFNTSPSFHASGYYVVSMSYGAAPMPVHDLAGTRTSVPPGNSELKKRPLSPNTLHSDQGVQSIKRQRHVIPVAEPDCGEESLMELVRHLSPFR